MIIILFIKDFHLIRSFHKGTGKTLAYLLPLVQRTIDKLEQEKQEELKEQQEQLEKEEEKEILPPPNKRIAARLAKKQEKEIREKNNRRPRVIVLVPNRELAYQIYATVKQLCRDDLTCALLIGGPQRNTQARQLKHSSPDIIVGTPQRLLHHRKQGLIILFTFCEYNINYHYLDIL